MPTQNEILLLGSDQITQITQTSDGTDLLSGENSSRVQDILEAHGQKSLGQFVRGIGKIDTEGLDGYLEIHKETGEPIGTILVDNNVITMQELVKYLKILGVPPKIGEMLCADKIITRAQLKDALEIQDKIKLSKDEGYKDLYDKLSGSLLGAIFVKSGYVNEETLLKFLSRQKKVNYVYGGAGTNLGLTKRELFDIYSFYRDLFEKFDCLPINVYGNNLVVAVLNIGNRDTIIELGKKTQKNIIPVLTEPTSFGHLRRSIINPSGLGGYELKNNISDIITHAILRSSSDLHFLPTKEGGHNVFLRLDGEFKNVGRLAEHGNTTLEGVIRSNSKGINPIDIFRPQNGTINQQQMGIEDVFGHNTDIRVALNPARNGFEVVMRIIDNSLGENIMADLNIPFRLQYLFELLAKSKQSLTIFSGTTGSGKSTSQRAMYKLFNGKKIATVEDPIEVEIDGVVQHEVKDGISSFLDHIKGCLRADIDVIGIGEVRDEETAAITVSASSSGHHVITTLHTSNSIVTIPRLLDFGVKKDSLLNSLKISIHQGLVKKLCPACKKKTELPDFKTLISFGIQKKVAEHMVRNKDLYNIYEPCGCPDCQGTGYKGRIGVFEFFAMTQEIIEFFINNEELNVNKILQIAREQYGMTTFYEEVLRNVVEGNIYYEELNSYVDFTGGYNYEMFVPEKIIELGLTPFKIVDLKE